MPSFSPAPPITADHDTSASSSQIEGEGYSLRSTANISSGADSSHRGGPEATFDGTGIPELLTTKCLPCTACVYATPKNTRSMLQEVLASSRSHETVQPNMMVSGSLRPVPTSPITSPEEALQAMNIVLNFVERQPNGYLDVLESVYIGKIMKKLELETQPSS